MDLVVWSGPVAKFQVPGATVPGAAEHFFACTGDGFQGSTKCHDLANSWLDGDGRRIPGMLAAAGVSEADVDNLYLGAFSAGGSIVKRLLQHPADRAMVKAVMLADASYTSGATAPHAIEGYVDYIVDLTTDPSKLFVSTSSASPNKSYGSASDTMRETMKAASARSGVPVDRTLAQLPLADQPEQLERIGDNVISADYGMKGGGHGYHPKMAPEVWQQILHPWLAGDQPTPPVTPPVRPPGIPMRAPAYEVLGAFIVGGLVGYASVILVERMAS